MQLVGIIAWGARLSKSTGQQPAFGQNFGAEVALNPCAEPCPQDGTPSSLVCGSVASQGLCWLRAGVLPRPSRNNASSTSLYLHSTQSTKTPRLPTYSLGKLAILATWQSCLPGTPCPKGSRLGAEVHRARLSRAARRAQAIRVPGGACVTLAPSACHRCVRSPGAQPLDQLGNE